MRDWLKQSGARRGIQGHKHSLTAARTRLVRGMMVDPEEALQSNAVLSEPIENTHAIILFKSNVVTPTLARQSRSVLDRSMQILQDCCKIVA